MRQNSGFTVIEVLVVLAFLIGGGILFFTQQQSITAATRDDERKVAVNAMYYSIEEVYYQKHNSYPESIDSKVLRSVDPNLFTDPDGNAFGDSASNYHYDATDCDNNGNCKHYTLTADMEKEDTYKMVSRH